MRIIVNIFSRRTLSWMCFKAGELHWPTKEYEWEFSIRMTIKLNGKQMKSKTI